MYSRFRGDESPYESRADWDSVPGITGPRNAALEIVNGVLIGQQTWSLGVRWDPVPRYAVKMQWDHTRVRKDQFALWAHRDGRLHADATVNTFNFSPSFIF
ncbi:MAG: hypothetical protein D6758_00820 [Gammaproteobacteria bacterium]|nr:MAG: hypothetical protein D6758_00820 [Gammaproteobacteria bacterium]